MDYSNMVKHVSFKDIQAKLEKNKEPQIVTDIRNQIEETFNDIRFDPIPHEYFIPDGNGGEIELMPVSTFVHQFVPEVDWDMVAERKALSLGVDVEFLKEMWLYNNKQATTSGTVAHFYAEILGRLMQTGDESVIEPSLYSQYEEGYLFPSSPKEMAARDALEFIFHTPNTYFVMSEARVRTDNNKYNINYCGTFDLLLYYDDPKGENSGLKVVDWKTNKSLYNEFNESNNNMLLEPFSHLVDCPYSHYCIQQSSYRLCLEDIGLKVTSQSLVHLKEDCSYEFIKLPNLTEEVREIIS